MSLTANLQDLATRIATEVKAVRATVGSLPSLATTAKSNVVDAVNEVRAYAVGLVDDSSSGAAKTWSAQKIAQAIAAARADILGGADPAFDTLKELQDGLAADQTAVSSITAALAQRVRVDGVQSFTGTQQAQGRSNIAAAGSAEVGDTTTSFVTTFEQGLL